MNTKDTFIDGLMHIIWYNSKTHQIVVLSVKDKKDICLEFTGNEVDLTPNIPVFRDMLDNSILDTIKNGQAGKDD